MRAWVLVVALAGCYEPAVEACAISCVPGDDTARCPNDLTCGDDYHCHAPGDETTTCTFPLVFSLAPSNIESSAAIQGLLGDDLVLTCAEGECTADVAGGSTIVVTVVSTADNLGNEVFTRLTGGCDGRNTCTLTMDRPQVVNVEFLAGQRISIGYEGNGIGQIKSEPDGIDCSSATDSTGCTAVFVADEEVTLTALPESPTEFAGWTERSGTCDTSGADLTCTVPAGAGQVGVRTIFSVKRMLLSVLGFGGAQAMDKVEVFTIENGTEVPRTPCLAPGPCEELFAPSTTPTLRLKAIPGTTARLFGQWFGPCNDSQTTCEFALVSDAVVAAVFDELVVVSLQVNEGGILNVSPPPLETTQFECGPSLLATCGDAKYLRGTAITIDNQADRFLSWESSFCGDTFGPCAFTLIDDVTVAAVYRQPVVSVSFSSGSGLVQITRPQVLSPVANCDANGDPDCTVPVSYDQLVELKAAGADFERFVDCPNPTNSAVCVFAIKTDTTVTVEFKSVPPI